jgi:hypothetical protein
MNDHMGVFLDNWRRSSRRFHSRDYLQATYRQRDLTRLTNDLRARLGTDRSRQMAEEALDRDQHAAPAI